MAIRGADFKWYDGFFLFMLATSVDYTTVFVFRVLMFVDNGLSAGMGLDFGWQQRYARFCGRVVVLSILVLLLYPFLWAWTVIGTLWFIRNHSALLPEVVKKWGFLIWLLFSYCGLFCIACLSLGKVSSGLLLPVICFYSLFLCAKSFCLLSYLD
ncbi:E3 ubiquitin-protein ligase SIS3 [Glycine soja]|uniref:E3 ubiquitin-protein ligase SIS3 n=1 Tax=Glycine soja TaxID=3848 RepID=A0A0B2SVP5_GLYSO|nr:E3 ubiquitin-protein ligase SIS3 [Glycine soja]